jgi:xanthosine utilization system XapX-like protein
MDEEKPYHVPTADQHQPDDEAAVPDPADVVWDAWPEDAATMQVDVVAAAMDVGGADLLNFVAPRTTRLSRTSCTWSNSGRWRRRTGRCVASRSPAPPALEDIFGAVGVAVHQQANNANRHLIGGSVVETVTIRLEPRKDALISARQAVLDGGTSTPAVFAGTEEEDAQYDGWYDCIAQDAHRMEQLDDPEL